MEQKSESILKRKNTYLKMCISSEFFTWTALFITVTIAIIGGNIITIIVFWKLRSVLKRTYYLLINLAIADLIVGFGGAVFTSTSILKLNSTEESPASTVARFLRMDVFSGTASLTTLLFIAGERFLAIAFPFLHKVITTRFYMKCIAVVWITSFLMTGIIFSSGIFPTSFCRTISRGILGYFTIVCLIAISALYTAIWVVFRKVNVRIPRNRRDQNKRLAKTLAIVTLTSLIGWIPLSVHTVTPFSKIDGNCFLSGPRIIAPFLQMANSVINPLVYCYRMSEFRAVLKQNFPTCRNSIGRFRGSYECT